MAHTSSLVVGELPQPRRSLELLDAELARLGAELAALTPAQLELPSNLPGWRIYDLGVHITRVCVLLQLAMQRASTGDRTPVFGDAARPVVERIRAIPVSAWIPVQRDAYDQITRLVAGLTDDQLERMTFPHVQGERCLRWYCTQLLTEMVFHRWDLARSLGSQAPLDEPLAAYLLQFLLDPVEPLFAIRRGQREHEAFSVATAGQAWLLTTSVDGTNVARGAGGPEPKISASPAWLALAVYGRVRVDSAAFDIVGPPDSADRFAAIFGPTG
jgi:uncharacterized protein (TIGR03083 family)